MRKNKRDPIERGAYGLRYGYKEWGNIGCFGIPIVISGYVLYNILYVIAKRLFLICGYSHG